MIKLDKEKVIPSALDEEAAKKEDAELQKEVEGATKGIQDEPEGGSDGKEADVQATRDREGQGT